MSDQRSLGEIFRDAGRRGKEVWPFFWIPFVCCMPLWVATAYPLSTRVAAGGGLLAAIGGLAIIGPVIRAGGPFNWITLEAYKDIDPRLFSEDKRFEALRAKVNDPEALNGDRMAQHIYGPFMISVGTLLNGFSGFFS